MSQTRPVDKLETRHPRTPLLRRWLGRCLTALGMAASVAAPSLLPLANAGTADLANIPLGITTSNGKPNIMFILDDSGSMWWDWMPDNLGYWETAWPINGDWVPRNVYGYRSSQCNGVAYNPAVTYSPPVDQNGIPYPNATYGAALYNGYDNTSGTTNLAYVQPVSTFAYRDNFRYYYLYTGTQPALSWRYDTNGQVDTSTTFYNECVSAIGAAPGSTKFTAVDTSTLPATGTLASPNSQQNYANWYTYYRRRFLTMRTGAGKAFAGLDSNFRVGFTRINDFDPVYSSASFLNVNDFDQTQKNQFFSLLYSTPPNGGTPLRQTLAKVGQYYAKTLPGQTYDPMVNSASDSTLNSCRRNYSVLSTDGYWNGAAGTVLDGSTTVGQQDNTETRPMKDSANVTITSTTDTVTTQSYRETGTETVTTTKTRDYYQTRSGGAGCFFTTKAKITPQTWTQATATPYTTTYDITTTTTTTVVTTNGVTGTPTTSGPVTSGRLNEVRVNGTTTNSPATPAWIDGAVNNSGCVPLFTALPSYNPSVAGNTSTSGPVVSGTATTLLSTAGPTVQPTVTTTNSTGGDSDSLADVAEYYYKTDLRPDIPNGNMRIVAGSRDTATWQHMTTFTLGLGVKGVLTYDKNYLTQASGDYVDLTTGAKNWPVPTGTTGGSEDATHVDDLWHAAVNGRGQYFSAQNPDELSSGLQTAFTSISRENATGSAAASSSLKPVSGGDDLVFIPSFSPGTWNGDLRAYHFTYDTNLNITGINTTQGSELWSARARLDAQGTRTVWFNNGGAKTAFTYANLPAGQKAIFDNRCVSGTTYVQCASLTAAAKAKVTGANIVSYLAGDRSLEITPSGGDNSVFRRRDSRLGDIANASPVYVAAPPYRYADSGYASFAASKVNRKRVVYQAANDGMLHAFATGTSSTVFEPDSTGGSELWAFVPTTAMNEMWRLADVAFDTDHRYIVDATPVVGDVYDSGTSSWRTILVGGFGKGGRGYYALDITDPDAPSVLWEISNTTAGFANLGYTYGNPIITKLKNGTWTVIFSSGVNNVGSGDGLGYVYVVNAVSGTKLSEVGTTTGSTTTPSNLVKLNAWIDNDTNNVALRLYGGDMLGNFWRFDHDDNIAPAGTGATLLGVAQTPTAGIQPITVMPTLLEIMVNGIATPVVTFGTGRYLGISDMSDSAVQSIYVIKDTLASAATTTTPLYGVLRSTGANLVQQSMNAAHDIVTPAAMNWAAKNGWFVDLSQSARERINIDPTFIQGSKVAYASTIPDGAVCPAGGSSYVYSIDVLGGTFSKISLLTGTTVVGLTALVDTKANNGQGGVKLLGTVSDQSAKTWDGGNLPTSIGTTVKRSAWREIVD